MTTDWTAGSNDPQLLLYDRGKEKTWNGGWYSWWNQIAKKPFSS